jgi:hypothetical protein
MRPNAELVAPVALAGWGPGVWTGGGVCVCAKAEEMPSAAMKVAEIRGAIRMANILSISS